jgi:hypothetical protein
MYASIVSLKDMILQCVYNSNNWSIKSLEEFICDSETPKSAIHSCIENLEIENFLCIHSGMVEITDEGKYKIHNLSAYNTYLTLYSGNTRHF